MNPCLTTIIFPTQIPYLQLEPREKRQFEERILSNPYLLSTSQMRYLFNAGFPFNQFDKQWFHSYLQLLDFHNIHHHCRVRTRPLSTWVQTQRSMRLNGRLHLGREQCLNRIKFVWDIDTDNWERQYAAYKIYLENKGKIRCPATLIGWANRMRDSWDQLATYQKQLLYTIEFDQNPRNTIWDRNMQELESVFAAKDHLKGLSVRLDQFVRQMRKLHRQNRLDRNREARLEKAGVSWEVPSLHALRAPYASIWEMRYDEVKAHLQQALSSFPVYKWPSKTLARWVRIQRHRWSTLSTDKQARLSLLHLQPGEQKRSQWDTQYAKAQDLHKQLGNYHETRYKQADKTTERWIRRQFESPVWTRLQPHQKEKILALGTRLPPGQVQPLKWEAGFQRALRYTELGKSFGGWLACSKMRGWIRRQVQRRHELSPEQQHQLDQVTSRLTPTYFPIPQSARAG